MHAIGELDAVHVRHQDIGDDEVWMLAQRDVERLDAVNRLGHRMADVAEQRRQELAIDRAVVNDEDLRHRRLRGARAGTAQSRQ